MKGALCLLVATLALTAGGTAAEIMMMQILYESLCPYSIALITQQLPRAYNLTGPDYLQVQLVPFGKATVYPSGDGFAFRCQHGSRECHGNKLQACALARLATNNPDQVKFVICAMGAKDPSNPPDQCATDVGLSAEDLKTCASGQEGDLLLKSYGAITPPMIYDSGVPLVLFNKEQKYEQQDPIDSDLIDFICEKFYIRHQPLPPGCHLTGKTYELAN